MPKNADVGVQCPDNVEIEGKINKIELRRLNKWKFSLYVFLCIITGGLLYLAALWFFDFKNWLTLSDSDLENADRIIVYGADETVELHEIVLQPRDGSNMKVFEYRLFKYIYSPDTNLFIPAEFRVDGLTGSEIHSKFGKGLSTSEQLSRQAYFGKPLSLSFELLFLSI
jgi:hypothetical protein